ncbi:MAG: DUF4382 domain-containing protein [Dehalococcoidales bacterium]|nr:DUF4382 domain-containing protein [Dehalococcoidales bacterium]
MKRKTVFFTIGILTALLTLVSGCTSGTASTSSTLGQTSTMAGRLVINITDAPAAPQIKEVWLTVGKVEVHEDGVGWREVGLVAPARFDLLTLTGGIQTKLAAVDLTVGKYTQIRMEVSLVEIGLVGALPNVFEKAKLPSGTLKFVHPFEIVAGEDTELLFDFDALKSVNVTGNDKYMFKPVIKLTTTKQPKGNFVITTPSLPNGEAGVAYTPTTLTTTGGVVPYAWSLDTGSAPLPNGLALASGTGLISGTPDITNIPGDYTFTIKVVDGSTPQKSATKTFSINIAANGVLQIITTSLPDGTEDAVYPGATLVAVGGSGIYSLWELSPATGFPASLSLSNTGVISGTPADKGDYSFTVKVTDSAANTDTQVITIRINKAATP